MKKMLVVMLIAAATLIFSVSAFAATPLGPGSAVTADFGGASFIPSTSVTLNATSNDTQYCVTSLHTSAAGSTAGYEYGALNTTPTIAFKGAGSLTAGQSAEACSSVTVIGF